MGQCADMPINRPCRLSELQERFKRPWLLQVSGWGGVELHNVEIVGFILTRDLVDTRHTFSRGKDVCPGAAPASGAQQYSHIARQ